MSIDEPVIEFYTFSKTYHMAGWRIGFSIGNEYIIENLYKLKTNMDYGISGAIQDAAIRALQMPDSYYDEIRQLYEERADVLYKGITEELGWTAYKPGGAMYLWVQIPEPYQNCQDFAMDLLMKTGVVVTPGSAFGSEGNKYVRFALVKPVDTLKEVIERLKKINEINS